MGLSSYKGSVTLISGIKQANNGTFPLLEANAVQVDEDGTRLDAKLTELEGQIEDAASTADIDAITDLYADGAGILQAVYSQSGLTPVKDTSGNSVSIKGKQGEQGAPGLSTFVRFSTSNTGENMTTEWSHDQSYIGIATALTPPTDADEYTWCLFVNPYTPSGWTAAQITMLETIFEHIVYTDTETQATADALITSLRDRTNVTVDSITQSGDTLTIHSLANAPVQSGNTLIIN